MVTKDNNHDRPEPQIDHQSVQHFSPETQTNKIQQINPESVLESISLGVFTVNQDMQITSFNRAAEVIIGIPRQKAIGRKCTEVFCSTVCSHNCPMHQTFATHSPTHKLYTNMLTSQGDQIPVMVSTTPLRNRNNEIIGGTETFQDLRHSTEMPQKNPLQFFGSALTSRSPVMGDIIQTLPSIAAGRNIVLLEGESGTGKKTLARCIHALSPLSNKPFITFNCANQYGSTLEEKLLDVEQRATDGSTLFLYKINEMSTNLQVLLNNLLEISDNGNDETYGVRLLVSTEENLNTQAIAGRFCPTLYDKICSIVIKVPPLRERKEDIPLLIDHFIATFNQLKDRSFQKVSQEALILLMAYNFPGNIQELRDIIEQAAVVCADSHITPMHLPTFTRGTTMNHSQPFSMEGAIQEVEVQTIISALKRNNYNRQAAAHDLGIHKSTFFRKIKHLGIVLPGFDGRFRLPTNSE